jgi:hypothetical protein
MKKFMALILLFRVLSAIGQPGGSPVPGTVVLDSLVKIYQNGLGVNLPLYNGRQFYGYSASIKDHAFYPVNEWTTGSVRYDNMWYQRVPLMYDVYKDELVTMHPNGIPFSLFSDRVQEFSLNNKVFVRLFADKDNDIPTGFYQRLSTGKATAFVKRIKLLEEKINGLEVERKFLTKDMFYILKDGLYTKIRKRQSLLLALKDKNNELAQYLNQAKIKYKAGAETYIIRVTEFYNKLYQ